jgi:hypothetical protein
MIFDWFDRELRLQVKVRLQDRRLVVHAGDSTFALDEDGTLTRRTGAVSPKKLQAALERQRQALVEPRADGIARLLRELQSLERKQLVVHSAAGAAQVSGGGAAIEYLAAQGVFDIAADGTVQLQIDDDHEAAALRLAENMPLVALVDRQREVIH